MPEKLSDREAIREAVRERYAEAARASSDQGGCCGGGPSAVSGALGGDRGGVFGAARYGGEEEAAPVAAALASCGCGNPLAVAELREGEVVLDLGSGAGLDVLLSASRVGPGGRVYGLDMTEEMLELARQNQREAGVENVEWLRGAIEDVPLPDGSVDVVISNCVINLAADKDEVLREAARVLRPGGRFAVTDVIADPRMDAATRRDMERWTGCIAGALTAEQFRAKLEAAGFESVEVVETHRVHPQAGSAIVRATRSRPEQAVRR